MLRVATQLAEGQRERLTRWGVVSKSQINRMLHIELATELLLYAYSGVHPNKKSSLDAVIRGEQMIDAQSLNHASRDVAQIFQAVETILPNVRSTRFCKRADFYTVVTLLLELKAAGQVVNAHESQRNDLARDLLTEFGLGVEEVSERSGRAQNIPSAYKEHVKYLATVKEGTDSAQQRNRRANILRATVLAGVFDARDPRRQFNAQQRRILWNRNTTKACAICGHRIERWEDMHADHVQAYVRGGLTTVGNGAITHNSCNLSKGAR